jgi:cardiolipin synthase A/B
MPSIFQRLPIPFPFRREGKRIDPIEDSSEISEIAQDISHSCNIQFADSEASKKSWKSRLTHLNDVCGSSTSSYNKVSLYKSGDEAMVAIFDSIKSAKSYVWLETYILDDSDIGRRLVDELIAAGNRGCDVVILVDFLGSLDFIRSDYRKQDLLAAGVKIVKFNPPFFSSTTEDPTVGSISYRDHRKLLVTENSGFLGSMNIHKETISSKISSQGTNTFFDVHVKVQGPVIKILSEAFLEAMKESGACLDGRVPFDYAAAATATTPDDSGVLVQVFQSNVKKSKLQIQQALTFLLRNTEKSVSIASSYFMPPKFLRNEILKLCKGPIQANLLLSGTSDFWPIPGDLLAQTHAVRKFLPHTDTRFYADRHMHAKFMVVDSVYSLIGSFNFDRWSARRNLEIVLGVFDKKFAMELESLHAEISSKAVKGDMDNWWFKSLLGRGICGMAYWTMKMSSKNFIDGLDSYKKEWRIRKELLLKLIHNDIAVNIATSLAMPGIS